MLLFFSSLVKTRLLIMYALALEHAAVESEWSASSIRKTAPSRKLLLLSNCKMTSH